MTIKERIAQLEDENKSLRLINQITDKAKLKGFRVNEKRLKVHADAITYQEKNNCDYLTALKAVSDAIN